MREGSGIWDSDALQERLVLRTEVSYFIHVLRPPPSSHLNRSLILALFCFLAGDAVGVSRSSTIGGARTTSSISMDVKYFGTVA